MKNSLCDLENFDWKGVEFTGKMSLFRREKHFSGKNYANTLLIGIFLTCNFLGMFPSSGLLEGNFENLEFRWQNPITIYSVIILAINSFIGIDFLLHGVDSYVQTCVGVGMANMITGYIRTYNFVVSDILIRVCALFYCKKAILILQIIQELKQNAADISIIPNKYLQEVKTSLDRVIEVEKDIEVEGERRKVKDFYEDDINGNHNPWKINIMLGTVLLFQVYNTYERLRPTIYGKLKLETVFKFLHGGPCLLLISWTLHAFLSAFAHFFPFLACITIGGEMTSLYCKYKYALIVHLRETQLSKEYGNVFQQRFTREFKLLMKLFNYFSEIGAIYAGICVVVGTIAMAQYFYSFIVTWDISSLSNSLSCFYWIFLTSILGNSMQENILKGREEVRNILASATNQAINDDLLEAAKWMCTWKWKLAPCNLFVVNNHMIIAACGTVLTQIIFLFQIKMSETTICGDNLTEVCKCTPTNGYNASSY